MTEMRDGQHSNRLVTPQLSFEELELAVQERRQALNKREHRQAVLDQLISGGAMDVPASVEVPSNSAVPVYQPSIRVEAPVAIPEDDLVMRRDVYVNGVRSHLDPNLSNEDRHAYAEAERKSGNKVRTELVRVEDDYTSYTGKDQQQLKTLLQTTQPTGNYSSAFSGVVVESGTEKIRKFTRPTRRQVLVIGGVAGALTIGAGFAVAGGHVPGVSIPGITLDQAQAEANVADAITVAEPAPAEAGVAPPPPEVKLNAADITVIGDCLDPEGRGKAIVSATTNIGANRNYKLKTLDGKEAILANDGVKPHLEIPEAKVNAAACIPSEVRNEAIVVEGDKVKINWDKIDRQLGVVPGEKSPTVDVWDMVAEPGVTDVATVSALIAAMGDTANQSRAIDIARAEVAKQFIAESEPAIQAKMTEVLKAKVVGQVTELHAAKKAPTATISVEFTGTPKAFTPKTPAADQNSVSEVVDVTKTPAEFK